VGEEGGGGVGGDQKFKEKPKREKNLTGIVHPSSLACPFPYSPYSIPLGISNSQSKGCFFSVSTHLVFDTVCYALLSLKC
jgi:hypothetical protein